MPSLHSFLRVALMVGFSFAANGLGAHPPAAFSAAVDWRLDPDESVAQVASRLGCPEGQSRSKAASFKPAGISLSPAILEFRMQPGEHARLCGFATNLTTEPVALRLSATDSKPTHDPEGLSDFLDEKGPFGVRSWLHLPVDRMRLAPGETLVFPFELRVPAGAPAGTNQGAVLLSDPPRPAGAGGAELGVQARLAMQLFVTVPGELTRKLEIIDAAAPKRVRAGDDLPISFRVRNTGNTISHARSTVQLRSRIGGRVLHRTRWRDERVLRGAERQLQARWRDTPLLGFVRPEIEVTNEEGTVRTTLPTVWITPPWWLVAGLGLAIILPGMAVAYRRRQRDKRLLAESEFEHGWYDESGQYD